MYCKFGPLPRDSLWPVHLYLTIGFRNECNDPALRQLGIDLSNLIDFRPHTLQGDCMSAQLEVEQLDDVALTMRR
jgi:hypothetical protein